MSVFNYSDVSDILDYLSKIESHLGRIATALETGVESTTIHLPDQMLPQAEGLTSRLAALVQNSKETHDNFRQRI